MKLAECEKFALPSASFIPAVSIAYSGLPFKNNINLNLLPEKNRKKASKTASYLMAVLLCAAIVLGVVWGGSTYVKRDLKQKKIDFELSHLEEDVQNVYQKKERIAILEKEIETANQLAHEQISINLILNDLSRIIPSTSWVKSFSYKSDKGIRISGESDTASDLIPLLEDSELLENCVFLSAITKNQDGKERFLIGCDVKKNQIE